MSDAERIALPYLVIANALVVSVASIVLALVVRRRGLAPVPGPLQNAAERGMEWFVDLAKSVSPGRVEAIAPFLASLFVFILASNLLLFLPVPLLRVPPTSYFGATLGLGLCGTLGAAVLSARLHGPLATVKHLVWPNPLQLVTEASHVLSLSLRLFGNIGGEYLVVVLVAASAPYGMPLVIHALGLVPAVVQPMVFTLLVSSFMSESAHAATARSSPRAAATAITAEAR